MRAPALTALAVLAMLAGPAPAATLATGDAYAPYADRGREDGGLAVALVRAVYDRMGEPLRIEVLPWKRGYAMAATGRVDAAFPYAPSPEREADFVYSAPLFATRQVVYVRPGARAESSRPEGLAGLRICQPLGFALPARLAAMTAAGELRREEPGDLPTCFKMLDGDRADIVVVDERIGGAALAASGLPAGAVRVLPEAFAESTLHLIVPRSRADAAEFVARFDRAMAALRRGE
ncbi:MAG TPA: transporter substrate-binding domain-containing protein [Alphaproteobacteria bacterium]|nr:transporter substrate-binding domain-containing protein [Alphaproteobacteria bacterium]